MNKNLISFAVAAVLAGGVSAVSASNVTIFGKVLMSIDNVDNIAGDSDTTMESQNAYGSIGVKGSEDLGNGLTAMFQLDYGINPSNGGEFTGRDQWVGLKGDFGTVRLGTVTTNYKQSGAAIDPMWRTSLDSRMSDRTELLSKSLHAGKGDNGQGRATNTIRYDSPSFNGAKIVANYTLDRGNAPEDNDAFGIGVHYNQGPFFAAFDYITNDNGTDDDAWKLSGKYTMDAFALYGHYEEGGLVFATFAGATSATPGAATSGEDGGNLWHLGASFTMGSTMFYGAYGQGDYDDAAGNEYDTWTLAVKHNMSKRTSIYGGYAQRDDDKDADSSDVFTVGMVHNF